MKGRSTFTPSEIDAIRRLLREKVRADRGRQKRLRDQLRSIGFYISDFAEDQTGFSEWDLDQLISRGTIRIDEETQPSRGSDARAPRMSPKAAATEVGAATAQARERRRTAAERYRPSEIRLLLVAEAPPAALDRYFYFPDVTTQDSLFRYVARAVLGWEPTRQNKRELLEALKGRGVFLIDLQEEPRDGTPLGRYVPWLIERCRTLRPTRIILIKATVYDAAYIALLGAGLPVSSVRVPFPGSGRQREFLAAFARALES
jgi:hypothetical protein